MIKLIFVGKSKESWLRDQIEEYKKRISAFSKIELIEIKDQKIIGNNKDKIINQEGDDILKHIKDDYLIALDNNGKSFDSENFAKAIKKSQSDNSKITFVIGGALGLSKSVLTRANLILSLSKMTFTNQMVRVILIEQIYRAYTIINNREYHK